MSQLEIVDTNIYAIVAGAIHEFPRESHTLDSVVQSFQGIMENDGIFKHEGQTGIVSLVKLLPGTPVQVMMGSRLKEHLRMVQQQQMAAQIQRGGGIISGRG